MADADRTMLNAALAYASMGWPVFPCSHTGKTAKHPLVKSRKKGEGGVKLATTNPAQIDEWWTQWPRALVGIPTGAAIGAFVVDLDIKARPLETVMGELVQLAGGSLPKGPKSETQSGGVHLWFALPDDDPIGNRAGVIVGVDVRGDGGYVIAPPSKVNKGGGYTWLVEPRPDLANMPEAPARLLDAIYRRGEFDRANQEPSLSERATAAAPKPAGNSAKERYAMGALAHQVKHVETAGKGTRNAALNQAAFELAQFIAAGTLSESLVKASLIEAAKVSGLWNDKDDGPRSVQETIKSGMRAGASAPKDLNHVEDRPQRSTSRPRSPAAGGGDGPPGDDPPPHDDAGDGGEPSDPDRIGRCASQPQNDTGNGKRLLEHFGDNIIHVREVGWHTWDKTHWEAEGGDEAATRLAQQTAERILSETAITGEARPREAAAIEAGDNALEVAKNERTEEHSAAISDRRVAMDAMAKRKVARARFAVSSGNQARITAMLNQALPHCTSPPEYLDADPLALNVLNGTLRFVQVPDPDCPDPDIERLVWDVRLDDHARGDLIAKVAPVKYEPAAKCPKWHEYLERFQPTDAVRDFLRDFYGYSLTGLTGEQKLVFHWGAGANGKSTLIEAVSRIMGPYAQSLNSESLTGSMQRRGDQATPDFARLPGARLVRVSELPRGEPIKENLVKALTGGEPILARHLNKGFFEFTPVFKPSLSGNDRPVIHGTDHGIWRRVLLVPWQVQMGENDPMRREFEVVQAEFAAERSGILNWLVEGALSYLNAGRLNPPPIVSEATQEYRAEMDPIGRFIDAHLEDEPGGEVTARDMYNAFKSYCEANGVKPFTETTFGRQMPGKGYRKKQGRIVKYQNCRLIAVSQSADPDPPT